MHFDIMNGFANQTWYDDRYNCTQHFDISLIDPDLDLRSQECEKAKTFCTNYFTKFSINLNGIWHTAETC